MSDDYAPMPARERAAIAWRTVWPVLGLLLLWVAFLHWQDARFPSQAFRDRPEPTPEQLAALRAGLAPSTLGWVDFGILFGIPWFLLTKTNVMARRLAFLDWLAISLMLTNLAFSLLYELFTVGDMFPLWFAEHQAAIAAAQNALRALLVASIAWSTVLLILIPERDRVRWPWVHRIFAPAFVAGAACLAVVAWRWA